MVDALKIVFMSTGAWYGLPTKLKPFADWLNPEIDTDPVLKVPVALSVVFVGVGVLVLKSTVLSPRTINR